MVQKMWAVFWLMESLFLILGMAQSAKEYNMDEYATCGHTINVDDSGVRLIGRGNASPSNPPTECIVYLQSVYARDDGSNKLQIKIESLSIKDCNVKVDLFNGRTSVGAMGALSCQYSSTDLVYSTGREVTVKLSRPDRIVFNDYQFSFEVKPFTCRNGLEQCQMEFTQAVQQSKEVSTICGLAWRSLACVEDLRCESEMFLRTAIRIATHRLSEKNIQSCELGTRFPKDREYSKECQQKRETCLNVYIDNLLNHNSSSSNHTSQAMTILCQDLNNFATCEMKPDSCELKKVEVETFVNGEKTRLSIPTCNVDIPNKGALTDLSLVLCLSTLLTLLLATS